MKRLTFALLLMTFVFQACSSDPSHTNSQNSTPVANQADSLFKDVMNIHDEAMAKMGTLHQLKKELEAMKSTSSVPHDTIDSLIMKIERADEGMFDWMGNFKDPRTASDQKRIIDALHLELEKVQIVANDIDAAINEATQHIEKE